MLRRRDRGFALVATLWLLVLMSVIASSMSWSSRLSLGNSAAMIGSIKARYLAEGSFQLAYANLLQTNQAERLLADGEILHLELPGGLVALKVTDDSGKVDINAAARVLIARLLHSLDVEQGQADALADAIVDYRDEDSLSRLNGAEDEDYARAGLGWGAKDAPFSSIGELRQVLGMTPEVYEQLAPNVTIYSRHAGVNPEVASLEVLAAVSGESMQSLENYVQNRRLAHESGLLPPRPPAVDARYLSRVKGVTYTLVAVGLTDTGQIARIDTTIKLKRGRSAAVVQTLAWGPTAGGDRETSSLLAALNTNAGGQLVE